MSGGEGRRIDWIEDTDGGFDEGGTWEWGIRDWVGFLFGHIFLPLPPSTTFAIFVCLVLLLLIYSFLSACFCGRCRHFVVVTHSTAATSIVVAPMILLTSLEIALSITVATAAHCSAHIVGLIRCKCQITVEFKVRNGDLQAMIFIAGLKALNVF